MLLRLSARMVLKHRLTLTSSIERLVSASLSVIMRSPLLSERYLMRVPLLSRNMAMPLTLVRSFIRPVKDLSGQTRRKFLT